MTGILEKWVSQSGQAFRPLQASLELTNRCNERCTHCYIPEFRDDPQRTLSCSDWLRVLDQLRGAGVLYLIYMGGEAMLNPHFWDIAAYGRKLGFHQSMITNGLLASKRMQGKFVEAGIHGVTISLYALDAEIHDKMTQVAGSHQRTLRAIEFFRKEGLEITINCLLTRANIDRYFELMDWCLDRQIVIKPDLTVTAKLDGDLRPTKLRADPEQIRIYYRELYRRFPDAKPSATALGGEEFVCNAAKGKCAVTAYGELLPCIEIREPLGTLVHEEFDQIWNHPGAQKWRQLRNQDINFPEKAGSLCEHCPGMANNEAGKPTEILEFDKMISECKLEVISES